ncbi:MAG TPA: portal protein, partial [Bacteroidia bacterium]|nr:portal protein [Bacteroidia bacterium]
EGNPIPPPQRPAPPAASPAYVEQMKIAQEEMMMVSGQYQAQMGENENAKSGVAINARQRQGDRATYHFIDNQAIAIRRTGKILIDLIPKVYDTQRIIRIEAKDGTIMNVTIDPNAEAPFTKLPPDPNTQPEMDNQQQIVHVIFNPNVGTYDVQSDTGPSFATRRQEAFNALTQIAAQNKEFMNIGGDLLWKVADFPEAQELARRWRKIIPPNILGDAPNPQQEQMMHQAADKIEQQLAIIAKQQKELDDKNRELTVKERDMTLKEAMAGNEATIEAIQEIRADFDSISKRITALGNSGPAISVEQIQPLVKQVVMEALKNGGELINLPGPHEGGTSINSLEQPFNEAGEALEQGKDSLPDVPGSRLAPNGRHYVKNNAGNWLEVQKAENA